VKRRNLARVERRNSKQTDGFTPLLVIGVRDCKTVVSGPAVAELDEDDLQPLLTEATEVLRMALHHHDSVAAVAELKRSMRIA